MRRWNRQVVIVLTLVLVLGTSGVARATSLGDPSFSSSSYGVVESELGAASGDFTSSSANYSNVPGGDDSGSSLGEAAVGNSGSASYQSNSGFNTTAQPGLTFTVDTPGTVNLGALSTVTKTTGTATFHVTDYTSSGYVVTMIGSPPANGAHPLTALTTDTASSPGTEQFGVNTVANTGVGASPVENPAGPPTFGYGVAGDGLTGVFGSTRPYTIPDKWRFNSGETVASSSQTSGNTDYTMTFLANISSLTPGGQYAGTIVLVATGSY